MDIHTLLGRKLISPALYEKRKVDFLRHRNAFRKIRTIRNLSGRTNFTRRLHNFSGICAILFIISLLVFRNTPEVWWFIGYILAGTSAVAFVIEANKTSTYLLGKWWNTWLGKLIYSLAALVITLISTLMSKQIVHELTGVNPSYYPEFISLLSILITVFLILFIMQLVVGMLSVIYMMKAYGIMLVDMMLTPLMGYNRNFVSTCVRIISGKKEKHPSLVLGWYSTSMLFGAMTLLYVLSYPGQLLTREPKNIESILTKSLVVLEYKTKTKCKGLPSKAKVVYLNKSFVSVVKWNTATSNYEFDVDECKFG